MDMIAPPGIARADDAIPRGFSVRLGFDLALAGHEGVMQPTAAMLRMRALATFKKQLCVSEER
jgi:hypothetical protein